MLQKILTPNPYHQNHVAQIASEGGGLYGIFVGKILCALTLDPPSPTKQQNFKVTFLMNFIATKHKIITRLSKDSALLTALTVLFSSPTRCSQCLTYKT